MKNKKIVFGIILLFAITGICNIQSVSADTVTIHHSSYVYYHTSTLEYRDEINLYVSSSGDINIYIMNAGQFSKLQDSLGLIWEYEKRWKDTTYVDYTFFIPENGMYYIVLYNKNLIFKRTAEVQITINYYSEPFDDVIDESGINYFWILLFYVVFPIVAIVLVIAIPIILIRRHKRKSSGDLII